MKNLFITLIVGSRLIVHAQNYTYSTNLYGSVTSPLLIYNGTNGADTNADNVNKWANKINANANLFWNGISALSNAVKSTEFADLLYSTNAYTFVQGTNSIGLFTNVLQSVAFIDTNTWVYALMSQDNTNWTAFTETNGAVYIGFNAETNGTGAVSITRYSDPALVADSLPFAGQTLDISKGKVLIPLLIIDSNNASTFGYGYGLLAYSTNGGTNWLNVSVGSNLWSRVLLQTNW